jgi:O-antigen/teichoic acid export membrane protein
MPAVIKVITRNIFSNWTAYIINAVVVFFLSPFVVHTLGNTGYGLWVLIGSLTGYLGILDFGIRPAIVRFVSRFHAVSDTKQINAVVNTTLVLFTIIGAAVAILSFGLAYLSDHVFTIPPELKSDVSIAIVLVGFALALSFPFGVFNATLNAMQRFDLNNIIQVTVAILRAILIVVSLRNGGGIVSLAVIALVTGLIELIAKYVLCRRIVPSLKLGLEYSNVKTLKMIAGFSLYTFLISVALRLSFQSDSLIIGAIISTEAIAFFAIASTMVDYLSNLVTNVSVTLTPVASALQATNESDKLQKLLIVGTRYSLLLILPIATSFIIFGHQFMKLWMGPEFAERSSTVLIILSISYVGYLAMFVANSVIYAFGAVRKLAIVVTGVAISKIILSFLLAKPFGITGVAIGTSLPLALYGYFFMPVYVCRLTGLRLGKFALRSYWPHVPGIVIFALSSVAALYFFNPESLLGLGAVVSLALIPFSAISFFLVIDKDHRDKLLGKLRPVSKNAASG